jgi:hypothetical protein
MAVRHVRLPDRFYLPRVDSTGAEVRDVVPWEGATSYVTDGERVGIQYGDGRVAWLGSVDGALPGGAAPAAAVSFHEDFEGVDLEALVAGIREYIDRHPVLRSVWREDLQELDLLRRGERAGSVEGMDGTAA